MASKRALLARENHRSFREDGFGYEGSAMTNPEVSLPGQLIAVANEQGGSGQSTTALAFCRGVAQGRP